MGLLSSFYTWNSLFDQFIWVIWRSRWIHEVDSSRTPILQAGKPGLLVLRQHRLGRSEPGGCSRALCGLLLWRGESWGLEGSLEPVLGPEGGSKSQEGWGAEPSQPGLLCRRGWQRPVCLSSSLWSARQEGYGATALGRLNAETPLSLFLSVFPGLYRARAGDTLTCQLFTFSCKRRSQSVSNAGNRDTWILFAFLCFILLKNPLAFLEKPI